MNKKPILVGMNNPVSTRPGHELYPLPDGCTGNRIWRMLSGRRPGVGMKEYLETFERRNLVRGVTYRRLDAMMAARQMLGELLDTGRTVVLLGGSVREAFSRAMHDSPKFYHETLETLCLGRLGLPPVLVHPQMAGGCTWRQIPHPSGRNLWYNVPKNRETVAMLLEELYVDYHKREK